MSSIDNRIVQMQFENSQFEKGVAQSLKSLEDLKKGLDLKDADKSLESLQKAGDSFSLAKMAKGVEEVTEKFSILGIIGKRILENLADSAYSMGVKFAKSVSVDQISAGWGKYAEKTQAVQTIMAATGADIDTVSSRLDKLAWYTDETSYSFTDMVSNIGKFTAMGIDLDTSVSAMQGIANWAALSGAGIQGASRAMYNLSQAIGVGAVKMLDWRSIENAGMATKEFKTQVIETAKAMGVLSKEGKTKKGTLVTFENFGSTLSEGWFSKDVLIKSLEKYGEYTDRVYEIATEKGITCAEAMELVADGTVSIGEKAFRAAQEAKTFTEAIDAAKEAVATGWMKVFEAVFGNYEQAKELWTDLANFLWEVFAEPVSNLGDLLTEWNKLGGRAKALEGVYDIFRALKGIILAVKEALAEIFPPATITSLYRASEAVERFGKKFREYFFWEEETVEAADGVDRITEMFEKGQFKIGDATDELLEFQQALYEAGYLEAEFFGRYDYHTSSAYRAYKKQMREATETSGEVLENTFAMWERGPEVKAFQERLIELGHDVGAAGADGIFGPETKRAYEEYRREMDKTEKKRKELKRGAKDKKGDTSVADLQRVLIEADLLDEGQADGIFGEKTENALKQWQEAHGLLATGILDEETIKVMYAAEDAADGLEAGGEKVTKFGKALTFLKNIFKGAFAIFKIAFKGVWFIARAAFTVLKQFAPLGEAVLTIINAGFSALTGLDEAIGLTELFDSALESLEVILKPVAEWAKKAADALLSFFGIKADSNWLTKPFDKRKDQIKSFLKSSTLLEKFGNIYKKVKKKIEDSGVIDKLTGAWERLKGAFEKIREPMETIWNNFKEWASSTFGAFIDSLPDKIAGLADSISSFFVDIIDNYVVPFIENIPQYIQDIGDFFSALFNPGEGENNEGQGLGSKVLEFLKSLPGKILEFVKNLPYYAGLVWDGLKAIWDALGISEKFEEWRPTLEAIWEDIKEFGKKLWEAIKTFFNPEGVDENTDPKEAMEKRLSGFTSLGDWFKEKWEGFKANISSILSGIGSFIGKVFGFLKKYWFLIANGLIIWFTVIKPIRQMRKGFKDMASGFKNLTGALKGAKKQSQPLSKSVLQFAAAIALIAGAIWLMGSMDTDALIQGGVVITIIGGIIAGFMIASAALRKKGLDKGISNIGKAVFQLSIAIAIIAGLIILMSFVPWETFWNGLGKVAIVAVGLGALIWALNKVGAKKLNYKGLIGLAVAIGILGYVASKLGKLDKGTLIRGGIALAAISGILVGLVWSLSVASKKANGKLKLGGFIALAAAIAIIAVVMAAIGSLDNGTYIKGLVGVIVIAGLLIALMLVMKKVSSTSTKTKVKGNAIKNMAKGALAIVVALGILVGGIATILAGLGALDTVLGGGLIDSIKHGGEVIGSIVDALSPFLGTLTGALIVLGMLFASMVVGKIKDGPKDMVLGALSIAGALGILVSGLTILMLGIGAIAGINDGAWAQTMLDGASTLTSLLGALVSFDGNGWIILLMFAVYLALSEIVGQIEGDDKGKNMIFGALAIAAALAIFVSGLAILMLGIGAIAGINDGEWGQTMLNGANTLTSLLGALVSFDGNGWIILLMFAVYLALSEIVGQIEGDDKGKNMIFGALAISAALGILVSALTFLMLGIGTLASVDKGTWGQTMTDGAAVLAAMLTPFNEFTEERIAVIGTITAVILGLSEAVGLIPGGPYALIMGALAVSAALGIIVSAVTLFVAGLGALDEVSDGSFSQAIADGGAVLETLGAALYGFVHGYINGFITDIDAFATAVANLREAVSGMDSEKDQMELDMQAATDCMSGLYDWFDQFKGYAPNPTGIKGYNTAAQSVSSDVIQFGRAIGTLRTNIIGVASEKTLEEDVGYGIQLANKLKTEFFDVIAAEMPSGDGLTQYNTQVSSLLTHIQRFAEIMGEARGYLVGLSETDIVKSTEKAIAAARKIKVFLTEVNGIEIEREKTGLVKLIGGDETSQTTIFDAISYLSAQIYWAAINLGFVNFTALETSFDSALSLVRKMDEFIRYIADNGGDDVEANWFNWGPSLITHVHDVLFGDGGDGGVMGIIEDFDNRAKESEINLEPIATLMSSISTLAELTSGTGDIRIDSSKFLVDLDVNDVVAPLGMFAKGTADAFGNVTDSLTSHIEGFNQIGKDFVTSITTGMKDDTIDMSGVGQAASKIETTFRSYYDSFKAIGKYFAEGVSVGVLNGSAQALFATTLLATAMLLKLKEVWHTGSPSKETAEFGKYFVMGITQGIKTHSDEAIGETETVAESMLDTAKTSLTTLSSLLAEDIDDTPVIRPIVDLTDARAAASSIGGMFHSPSLGVESTNLASKASASNAARVSASTKSVNNNASSAGKTTNSAVNLTGNNFYVRNDSDIKSLANELATLTANQQRSLGAAF